MEISLIIQLLALIQANVPWVVSMLREGRGADIDWKSLKARPYEDLEAEVDCPPAKEQ